MDNDQDLLNRILEIGVANPKVLQRAPKELSMGFVDFSHFNGALSVDGRCRHALLGGQDLLHGL